MSKKCEQTKMQHTEKSNERNRLKIRNRFIALNKKMLKSGFSINTLHDACEENKISPFKLRISMCILVTVAALILSALTELSLINVIFTYALGTRCFIPNNYFIWEATRPISDCQFCFNVTKPIILPNISRDEFSKYAYSSKPIILKNAIRHWPAVQYFSFDFLKDLYENTEGAYESVEEDCQFLHFQSDFTTLRDVFNMSKDRSEYSPGEKPWYVGWCSSNPAILEKMRKYYPIPHFLPIDSELSNREYIFMGYDQGATMHLDFISRLMWQAQLLGNKTWNLVPSPECDHMCKSFEFYVEPGDAMLLDTRVWYHGTTISPGEFSLTIQSEYS